jgi:hypothetical protein
LRVRFNAIHAWAIDRFGEVQLLAAVGTLRSINYRPPRPEESDGAETTQPTPPKLSLEAERIARAKQLIDEVCDRALALGWTMESLYFSDGYERRPFAARYGMACYIGGGHRIGEVTRQSIELIGPSPSETRSRFYNPDVEQPWIRRAPG